MSSPRRLKVSPKNAQRIIDIVLSDERLMGYVISLVHKRLTPDVVSDEDWCNKVVDLSIEQVLNEVNVFDLLKNLNSTSQKRHTSHAHGSTIQSKSQNGAKRQSLNNEEDMIRPAFSSTEPKPHAASSPRRVVKELNKKKPIDLDQQPDHANNIVSPPRFNRSASVESDASTVQFVQSVQDGPIIPQENSSKSKNHADWVARTFASARSDSPASSNNDDLFESVLDSEVNTSVRSDARGDIISGQISPIVEDNEQEPEQLKGTHTVRLPTVHHALQQSTDSSTNKTAAEVENDDFLAEWERKVLENMRDGDEEGSEEGSHAMQVGAGASADDGEWHEVRVAPRSSSEGDLPAAVAGAVAGVKADQSADTEYSSDSPFSSDDDSDGKGQQKGKAGNGAADDYLASAREHSYSSSSGAQVLFFDQARFDADADFFSAESEHSGSPPGKGSRNTSSAGKQGTRSKRRAELEQGGSPRRVRFAPQLISEVRYRDRVGYAEKSELFFTHNEEYQFTLDQSKEIERAQALGMTWMEWMDLRTDEDVQREEQAEADALASFRLYSGDYYEEEEPAEELEVHFIGVAGSAGGSASGAVPLSPLGAPATAGAARVLSDANGHNFKSANAHAPPALHHNSHHYSPERDALPPTSPSVPASHKSASTGHSSTSDSPMPGVVSEDLSVPSCSDSGDEDEYDFDNDF